MENEPIGDRKRGEAGSGGSPIKTPKAIASAAKPGARPIRRVDV
jgi:hypothetical protein